MVAIPGTKAKPEREHTNESLREERAKSDQAIAEKEEAVEESADKVVKRAREKADEVLLAARSNADKHDDLAVPAPALPGALAEKRALEDEILRAERDSADKKLRREREDDARALSSLLPLEREKTDKYLLTERARSDAALAHRDDFLGIASHDLRSLLSGVVLNAALLSAIVPQNDSGKQAREVTERIRRYAARMNRLVGDLVDVASIDAGRLALSPTRGEFTAAIVEAMDMFQAAASAKEISLVRAGIEGPLLVEFDHERMLQVLANLITNAIKFTARKGTITVRAERAADELRVSVSDDGSGIPPSLLRAIFERFWQVDKSDTRGMGLGLYISRCIVEAHRGTIWAESTLGEGSKVCFTLPLG